MSLCLWRVGAKLCSADPGCDWAPPRQWDGSWPAAGKALLGRLGEPGPSNAGHWSPAVGAGSVPARCPAWCWEAPGSVRTRAPGGRGSVHLPGPPRPLSFAAPWTPRLGPLLTLHFPPLRTTDVLEQLVTYTCPLAVSWGQDTHICKLGGIVPLMGYSSALASDGELWYFRKDEI